MILGVTLYPYFGEFPGFSSRSSSALLGLIASISRRDVLFARSRRVALTRCRL